jgi:hypothetical protein
MRTGIFLRCALLMIVLRSLIVPKVFEVWVTATILVLSVRYSSNKPMQSSPVSLKGNTFNCAFFSSQTSCHGTILEWCSISVISTSSPSWINSLPKEAATKFIDSVVPLVNIIS